MTSRYAGVVSGSICIVSDGPIMSSESMSIINVPAEHHDRDPADIIMSFKVVKGELREKRRNASAKNMKIAFVGNWKMRCGIATYAENLWPEVAKYVSDFRLFVEKNDSPTGPMNVMGSTTVSPDKVIACWKRGESLRELIACIKDYDPDVVWIQHEFGIWPNASYWLSLMSQLSDYRVIVTMHSVFHHLDKTIVEAAMPEIVVHLEGARKVLKEEKSVVSQVHVIPHGCDNVSNEGQLWNYYKSDHTFMQFGFGFEYKGWENSIRVAAILRKKYSDVFFTGLFSESPFNAVGHQLYYEKLMKLVDELNLNDNVAIIRGYQSDVSLDAYIRTNQAVVFPYVSHPAHEVFGVSGAARLAMTKGIPVVTTNVNHFSDIPTLKGSTDEEIADALDRMFSNAPSRKQQVELQTAYVSQNTWENAARLYVDLFERKS